ncbi:MAG: type I methionyl aminopeptidase, partial [Eggerthellaceae bacterium]|nr:type I methionyl aminopeptidase [Eggerthellaceae bacterium]
GDNAWTYPVGNISDDKKRLLRITEECMWAGIDEARIGNRLGDIGAAVQEIAETAGYGVVREYVGHGIGRNMHEDPNVPNYGYRRTGMVLEEGMVLAIEPMINLGTHQTKSLSDGWGVITADGLASAHFEKTVAITKDGPVVLTTEENFKRPV